MALSRATAVVVWVPNMPSDQVMPLGVEGDFLSATNYACATRWSSFRRFFMKSRQVSFYVQLHEVSQLMAAVQDHVIPRYEALPHFLGLTVIKCDSGHAPR